MIVSQGTPDGHMRICMAYQSSGGPEGFVTAPLEESDVLGYYETRDDGSSEHTA
jgi:hypothetical protein